jgi:DNA-binding MurR/RpiR family transcriptional regulator
MDLFSRIKQQRENMSASFGKVTDFVYANYEEVALMSISEVAEKSGVSESVVVRFAAHLGYSGFAEMKAEIKHLVRKTLRMPDRMLSTPLAEDSSYRDVFNAVLNKDIENILKTLKDPYNKDFDAAVQMLKRASRVYVTGARGLSKVAELVCFLLDLVGIFAIPVNAGDSAEFQILRRLRKCDVLLAFSLPRYDEHITKALHLARELGSKTILIVDSAFAADTEIADLTLVSHVESCTFINSYCALVSVVNAVVAAIGIKYRDETLDSLNRVEECYQRFQGSLDQKGKEQL